MTDNNSTPNLNKLDQLKEAQTSRQGGAASAPITSSGPTQPTTDVLGSVENFTSPDQGLDIDTESIEKLSEEETTKRIQEAQEYENNLNQELGLELPSGLSEIDQDLWKVYFQDLEPCTHSSSLPKMIYMDFLKPLINTTTS
ncbi:MAG: hypothetical protein HC932_02240 [Thermales bacterium]|nr:hypothetical protein [Thermales bacterium]